MSDRAVLLVVSPFALAALERAREYYEVVNWQELAQPQEFLAVHGDRVRAMITNGIIGIPSPCKDSLKNLGVVACNGVGYDAIDMEWVHSHSISVTNTPDVLSGDVADWAIALTLSAYRQLPQADRFAREGSWSEGPFPLARRFHGSRVGILGLGRIGSLIAKRAMAFDASVAYCGRTQRPDAPYEYFGTPRALAEWADALIVCAPGGTLTKNLISHAELDALGPSGILVNISRGSVVDEQALVDYLQTDRLFAAGLDVFHNEPQIHPALKEHPRVTLSPHIASATIETRQAMAALVVDNLIQFANGKPLVSPVAP